ncbi:MAG: molybdopterin-dependent oxidoreductase, partial [Gemmatimonadota bacterium]|nr:molybdopterin-dependent oxidoreductase [Gemmatimonadota bacterium]
GTTILEAALSVGIEVPHFCYHPALSIAGACRMCLVEIEDNPKLQISCHMTVADQMVVFTDNKRVRRARRAIMEFHLVNHPLDCPVCDQAGECGLQEYYMLYGRYISRVSENKVKKTRKAFPVGPHVMLDQERCILCSRCVRFCDEVSKSSELGIFQRGDRSEIDVFENRQLDNSYSGNVVDLCPVGALTDRDFRFKTRVWYLESAESICPGCSRGCNIEIHYNLARPYKNGGRRISRLKPRWNPEVNDWWLCDEGRYCFKFVDDEDRLTGPVISNGGSPAQAAWDEALSRVADSMRAVASGVKKGEMAFLVSPRAANEELHLLKEVLAGQLPGSLIAFSNATAHESPSQDDFLRRADKNPNTAGAGLIGLAGDSGAEIINLEELKARALSGGVGALYICYNDLLGLPPVISAGWEEALGKIETVIYQGTNGSKTSKLAQVVLPAAAFAEREGTVVNCDRRIQVQHRAFTPLSDSLPGWEIMSRLGTALGGSYKFESAEQVFLDLAETNGKFNGLDYEKIGPDGIQLKC